MKSFKEIAKRGDVRLENIFSSYRQADPVQVAYARLIDVCDMILATQD